MGEGGFLVDLDGPVDFSDEAVRGEKPDGSRQQPESQHHEASVTNIKQRRNEFRYLEFGHEVEQGVAQDVERRAARGHKTSPPPIIVLQNKILTLQLKEK